MKAAALLLFLTAPALAQPRAESLYRRARELRARPDEALALAERAARDARDPVLRETAERLVRDIRLDLGDVAGARAALGSRGAQDALTLALGAVIEGRAEQARAYARRMTEESAGAPPGERADAFRHQAQILRQLGDDDAAEESLSRALAAVPDYGPALRMLTAIRLAQGRPSDALAFLDRLARSLGATPLERAEAGARAAEIRLSQGDLAGAEKDLAAAREFEPERPSVLDVLARLRLAQGERAQAAGLADRLARAARASGSALARADARLREAGLRRALGDDAGAERSLRAALADAPRRSETTARLCDLLLDRGRKEEAVRLAAGLVETSSGSWPSDRAAALQSLGRVQRAAGDDAGAEASLKAALREAPASLDARRALAGLLLDRGRPQEALELARGLDDPALSARALLALGDPDAARRDYERALELSPDDKELLRALASLALARGRPEDALDFARRLDDPALLARVELALGDAAAARGSYRRALTAAPDSLDALGALAELELAAGRPQEALPLAQRLVELAPAGRRADAYQLLARVRKASGDEPGAAESLERALEKAPENRDALRALASARLAQGRARDALPLAERLVALSTPDAGAYELLARVDQALDDRDGAERAFRAALNAAPERPDPLSALADLALAAGRPAEALGFIDRLVEALRASPAADRAAAYRRRARIALALGDAAQARASLEKVLELDPADLETLSALSEGDAPRDAVTRVERYAPAAARPRAAWLVLRGEARARSGDSSGAAADFGAAVGLDARAACFGPGLPKRRERLAPSYFDLCLERFPEDKTLRADREVAVFMAAHAEKKP